MGGYFEAASGGAAAEFDEFEAALLAAYARKILELVDVPDTATGTAEDLIASAFSEGPTERPADPALARLFPDAYTDLGPDGDAEAASAEFRRYTENDLRARKRDDARAVVRALEELFPDDPENLLNPGTRSAAVHLDPDDCRQWLGALNDLRLVMASWLDITDDEDFDELMDLDQDDPRALLVATYGWLTTMQDTLVEAMMRSL
ncbi:DUF2017 domain-containing protein [Glycomyces algeriensis]|uniref:DUF2017 domain-containing protein n=1 Tax=Glycomyces algeriensis TaxID=256037 RepID=UPI0022D53461|nr:DUF2017 domain-containing protein [Glycomyces algeriensis]MDA1364518.1 DUF2017 domain-containing protein [Glycomyces algeriensis]MDR7350553.1 hypothetical protein [Glycomyces algeriensis]